MIEFLLGLYAVSFFGAAFFQYDLILSFACSVAVHEMGHLLAARLLSVRCLPPGWRGQDARIFLIDRPTELAEIFILLSGPLANFLLSILTLLFLPRFLFGLAALSFAMGIVNLFPVAHLDGGRMLCLIFGEYSLISDAVMKIVSEIFILAVLLFSAFRMLRYGDSFLAFFSSLWWILRGRGRIKRHAL